MDKRDRLMSLFATYDFNNKILTQYINTARFVQQIDQRNKALDSSKHVKDSRQRDQIPTCPSRKASQLIVPSLTAAFRS